MFIPFTFTFRLTEIDKHTFHIDANRLRKGLLDATRLNVYFPGFPALRFLPHTVRIMGSRRCEVIRNSGKKNLK